VPGRREWLSDVDPGAVGRHDAVPDAREHPAITLKRPDGAERRCRGKALPGSGPVGGTLIDVEAGGDFFLAVIVGIAVQPAALAETVLRG
jgi:hypothetical protein